MMKQKNTKAFTLVEIMIVVAIIILLAALAIPNMFRMRLNANEAAAIASLRTISTAMENYRAAQTPPAYPTTLLLLSGATPAYIDMVLGSATKQGYTFIVSNVSGGSTYTCTGAPESSASGVRTFVVDQGGILTTGGTPIE